MKIIKKGKIEEEKVHNMLELEAGVYLGIIVHAYLPGIVIVSGAKPTSVIYCFEGKDEWFDARKIGNSHFIKNLVKVKIETITTIAF